MGLVLVLPDDPSLGISHTAGDGNGSAGDSARANEIPNFWLGFAPRDRPIEILAPQCALAIDGEKLDVVRQVPTASKLIVRPAMRCEPADEELPTPRPRGN